MMESWIYICHVKIKLSKTILSAVQGQLRHRDEPNKHLLCENGIYPLARKTIKRNETWKRVKRQCSMYAV